MHVRGIAVDAQAAQVSRRARGTHDAQVINRRRSQRILHAYALDVGGAAEVQNGALKIDGVFPQL